MELPLAAGLTATADPSRPAPMRAALALARAAARRGEVPVGALVTDAAGRRLAAASNRCEKTFDATAHAEVLALRAAGRVLGSWRLTGCTLWVTLEPCPMCAHALSLARVARVVFAAFDPHGGGRSGGLSGGPSTPPLGGAHRVGGVMATEAEALLSGFFAALRSQAKGDKQRRERSR